MLHHRIAGGHGGNHNSYRNQGRKHTPHNAPCIVGPVALHTNSNTRQGTIHCRTSLPSPPLCRPWTPSPPPPAAPSPPCGPLCRYRHLGAPRPTARRTAHGTPRRKTPTPTHKRTHTPRGGQPMKRPPCRSCRAPRRGVHWRAEGGTRFRFAWWRLVSPRPPCNAACRSAGQVVFIPLAPGRFAFRYGLQYCVVSLVPCFGLYICSFRCSFLLCLTVFSPYTLCLYISVSHPNPTYNNPSHKDV